MAQRTERKTPERRLRNVWRSMLQRCENPRSGPFRFYGARGVRVCAEWHDFGVFAKAMGPHPGVGFSIDRINVRGHYEPGNCRWATVKMQARNRRDTVRIAGVALGDVAEARGLLGHHVRHRLARGWSLDRALQTPARRRPRRVGVKRTPTGRLRPGTKGAICKRYGSP